MESKVSIYQNQSVLNPQMISKEKEMLYASQVLIPTTVAGKRFALMGPLTVFEILKDTRKIFPVCYKFKPLFNKMDAPRAGTEDLSKSSDSKTTETLALPPKDPFKPFRSCPTSDIAYQNWFTKVESKKSQQWEKLGIYNLIKLSKPGFTYSHPLLFASLYFWDSTYNTFHLPGGMITPTFFDIAAITGLSPVGEIYIPDNEEHSNIIDFDVKLASFSKFISHYHTKGDEVSDV